MHSFNIILDYINVNGSDFNVHENNDDNPNKNIQCLEQQLSNFYQKQHKQSLYQKSQTQIKFELQLKSSILKYVVEESGLLLILFIPVTIFIVYINKSINISCQIDNSKEQLTFCQNEYEKIIQSIRNILFVDLGFIYFMAQSAIFLFPQKGQIFYQIYWMIVLILFILFQFFMEYTTVLLILWGLTFLYMICITYYQNLKWYHTIRRMRYNLIFCIFFYGYTIIILHNLFDLSLSVLTVLSNMYVAVIKTVIVKNFQQRIKLNINEYEDIRIQLLVLFSQDFGFISFILFTKQLKDLIFSAFFVNLFVMMIYNITQFHLWFYLFNKIITIAWSFFLGDKFQNLRQKVNQIIYSLWMNYSEFMKKINKKLEEGEEVQIDQDFSDEGVLMICSSYFIISSIFFLLFIVLTLIFQSHIPFTTAMALLRYSQIDPNRKQSDASILENVYFIDIYKTFTMIALVALVYFTVYFYSKKNNLQFFAFIKLNKKPKIFRLFVAFYSIFIFSTNCFR